MFDFALTFQKAYCIRLAWKFIFFDIFRIVSTFENFKSIKISFVSTFGISIVDKNIASVYFWKLNLKKYFSSPLLLTGSTWCYYKSRHGKVEKSLSESYHKDEYSTRRENVFMGKHLNPLEKEFLIRKYKSNPRLKMTDFCIANDISISSFPKWLKQYNEGGLEGLARADSKIKDVLPEGIDRTEESYKREILKLRIENERLKKTMPCGRRMLENWNIFV